MSLKVTHPARFGKFPRDISRRAQLQSLELRRQEWTIKLCGRCGRRAPKRGRMSAAVTLPNGQAVRRYLCRFCVSELQSGVRGRVAA